MRGYKKLPLDIKKIAEKKEVIFKKDPFDPSLRTHKLHGKLKDCLAFSISLSHRIVYEFGKGKIVYFHSIGTHDIYK